MSNVRNRQDVPVMANGSKMTRCVLHSIGLQLLMHPTTYDRLAPRGTTFSGIKEIPFSYSDFNYRGRILIPTTAELTNSMREASIAVRRYTSNRGLGDYDVCIVESILNDIVCYNATLESLQISDKPSIRDSPQPFEMDFTQSNAFETLTDKLASIFNDDFYWSLNQPKDEGFAYYAAFVILVVSDRDAIITAIQNQDVKQMWDKQVVSLEDQHETGSAVIQCLRPMKNLQFQYAKINIEYPITLVIIEDREVFRWLDGKKTSIPNVALFQQAKQDLQNYLRISRMKIVEWQIDWASSRLSELLVSLPERKLEQIEEEHKRIEELYSASDEIAFFRSLYLLVKMFIEREESDLNEDEISSNSLSPITENKKKLLNLDEKLSQMEDAVQIKLHLENMIIEKQKVEQQYKLETYFNKLSLFFAVFVVFEVIATYFSWALPPDNPIGHISFLSMIFGIVVVWWYIMNRVASAAENDKPSQENQTE